MAGAPSDEQRVRKVTGIKIEQASAGCHSFQTKPMSSTSLYNVRQQKLLSNWSLEAKPLFYNILCAVLARLTGVSTNNSLLLD